VLLKALVRVRLQQGLGVVKLAFAGVDLPQDARALRRAEAGPQRRQQFFAAVHLLLRLVNERQLGRSLRVVRLLLHHSFQERLTNPGKRLRVGGQRRDRVEQGQGRTWVVHSVLLRQFLAPVEQVGDGAGPAVQLDGGLQDGGGLGRRRRGDRAVEQVL